MRSFAPAETRTRLCFGSQVRFGAGLLVPLLVAPALAEEAPPAIVAVPSGQRGQREKLAPAVMTPPVDAALQQAADLAAFGETVKRLQAVEVSDPARALREYRRFLVGRSPSPALGVQIAVKVAQMRQKMGDSAGALLTCDVLGQKYASEPTSVLLSLQKSRVLMNQKRLAQASKCMDEALPDLLALGPECYAETSDLLLRLAQANVDNEGTTKHSRQKQAAGLYADVEEVYLHWLKAGTISHTWQMFEGLQADYEYIGEEKRAHELLFKAADALLQVNATPKNPEGADVSVMAARWLLEQGNAQAAQELYDKAPAYGNDFVSQVGLTDQGQQLLSKSRPQAAIDLMLRNSSKELDFGPQWIVAQAYWQLEDWQKAEQALLKLQAMGGRSTGADALLRDVQSHLFIIQTWKNKVIDLPVHRLLAYPDEKGIYHTTLYVHSFVPQSITVRFVQNTNKLVSLVKQQQQRADSGVIVTTYDLSYSTDHSDDPVKAQIEVKDKIQAIQEIEMSTSQ